LVLELREVEAPNTELAAVEILAAPEEVVYRRSELKSGSELATEVFASEVDGKALDDEIELELETTPEAELLTRVVVRVEFEADEVYSIPEELEGETREEPLLALIEVTDVELTYNAPVELEIDGVSEGLVEVWPAMLDDPPHVTVWLLLTAVVYCPLAEEVELPGSEGVVEALTYPEDRVLKALKPDWAAREDSEIVE